MAAANPRVEEKPYFPAVVDGSCKLPVSDSCFQLLKPSFDEDNRHCSLDVLPILFEEASFDSSHEQNVYSISMLPDEGNNNSQCTSQLAFLSFLEVPISSKSQMCLDAQLSCQNVINIQMESADAFSPCIVDIDVEKETLEAPKPDAGTVGSVKCEGAVNRVLRRQASLTIASRFVQLLLNHSSMLLKFISKDKPLTERVHDTPNARWRRYKRATSFDSRKVVLLFSILSSLGTMVLIYLTLRVRQTADGFVSV